MNHFYDLVKSQILIIFLFGSVTWAENDNRRTPIVKAVERVGASVVNINTEEVAPAVRNPFRDSRNPFFDHFFKEFFPSRDNNRRSLGSGVIIHPEGYILTNEHVVSKATIIKVTLIDKREFDARLVGADIKSDLAVIKIETNENLPHISLGRSDDLMIGETVIAIGNPFGLRHTVTTGIISALHRSIKGGGNRVYRGFIQLDASINPGNSGGPIYDSGGNIVGVVISQLDKLKMAKAIGSLPENVNFGIKASTVRQFLMSSGLPSKKSERTEEKSTEQLAEIAQNQALMVMCLQ